MNCPWCNSAGSPKLAYAIEVAAEQSDSSRSEIYEALKRGDLRAKKNGRRTVILHDDLVAYLASLPDYQASPE